MVVAFAPRLFVATGEVTAGLLKSLERVTRGDRARRCNRMHSGKKPEGRRLIGATVDGLGRGSEVPLSNIRVGIRRRMCHVDACGGAGRLDRVPAPPFLCAPLAILREPVP